MWGVGSPSHPERLWMPREQGVCAAACVLCGCYYLFANKFHAPGGAREGEGSFGIGATPG